MGSGLDWKQTDVPGPGVGGVKAIPFGGGDPRALGVSHVFSVEHRLGVKSWLGGRSQEGGRRGREFI